MMTAKDLKDKFDKKSDEGNRRVCIIIFEDGRVALTANGGMTPLERCSNQTPPPAPANTCDQALWYTENPICVWHRGIKYCF